MRPRTQSCAALISCHQLPHLPEWSYQNQIVYSWLLARRITIRRHFVDYFRRIQHFRAGSAPVATMSFAHFLKSKLARNNQLISHPKYLIDGLVCGQGIRTGVGRLPWGLSLHTNFLGSYQSIVRPNQEKLEWGIHVIKVLVYTVKLLPIRHLCCRKAMCVLLEFTCPHVIWLGMCIRVPFINEKAPIEMAPVATSGSSYPNTFTLTRPISKDLLLNCAARCKKNAPQT